MRIVLKYFDRAYLITLFVIAVMVCIFGLMIDDSYAVRPMYYMRCLMDGSVFALPILFIGSRFKRISAIIWCLLVALFLEANLLYYRVFEDLCSINDIHIENIDFLLLKSSLFFIKAVDIIIFIPLFLLYFIDELLFFSYF